MHCHGNGSIDVSNLMDLDMVPRSEISLSNLKDIDKEIKICLKRIQESCILFLRRKVGKRKVESSYVFYERFIAALNELPVDVRPQESVWIELFLQLDEPDSVSWSPTLREESVASIKEWIEEIEMTKSENTHSFEYDDRDESMSGYTSYDAKGDSYSQHENADVYSEQEENYESTSYCSNNLQPVEVFDLDNIDHLVVNMNQQGVCNQGYETTLHHIAIFYDQLDKGHDADASYCNDKINVHEAMSTANLMHASNWDSVHNTEDEAKKNENEGEGSLSSEQI